MSLAISALVAVVLYILLLQVVHPLSAAGLSIIVFATGIWATVRFSAWQLYRDCFGNYFKARVAGRTHPQALQDLVVNRYKIIHRGYRQAVESRFKSARASLMDDKVFTSDADELQALVYLIYTTEKGVPKEQPMVTLVKTGIQKYYQQYRMNYPNVWMDIMSEEDEKQ